MPRMTEGPAAVREGGPVRPAPRRSLAGLLPHWEHAAAAAAAAAAPPPLPERPVPLEAAVLKALRRASGWAVSGTGAAPRSSRRASEASRRLLGATVAEPRPLDVVAFFPLPGLVAAAPGSPGSRRTSEATDPVAAVVPQLSLSEPVERPKGQEEELCQIDGLEVLDRTATFRDDAEGGGIDSDDDSADSCHTFSSIGSARSSIFEDEHGVEDIWRDVPMGAPDAILGIAQAYRACANPRKVNVCVGAYRDAAGAPWVLPSVRRAEALLLEQNDTKEYLPIEGDPAFLAAAMKFAYGEDMPMDHLAAVQTLSGTGACRVGGEFLAKFFPNHPIYVPDPTWGNHLSIFKACGLDVRRYRYYNKAMNGLDFRGLLKDLARAPDRSIVLLHACAHNPTGCDPTIGEWKQLVSLCYEKEHVLFFDNAYQGFASGDPAADAQPFRYAVSQQVPILLAQSFAKNFGLYGERVGTLSVVCGDRDQRDRILSVLRLIVRPMYSSPPRHGSAIVRTVLASEQLTQQYLEECASMARRIAAMRQRLVATLAECGSRHDWSHLARQIGMFAYTGMTADMCERLTREFAIYLTTNGRISVAGLNDSNVGYVAAAIHAVTDGRSITGE